ncbi:MAG: hypothetical protein WAX04_13340, partial [Oscillospiraceae bacterium]
TEEIDELLMRLEAVNEKISDMKNIYHCHICGAKNGIDNFYCVKCGSKLKSEFDSGATYDNYDEESVADDTEDKE